MGRRRGRHRRVRRSGTAARRLVPPAAASPDGEADQARHDDGDVAEAGDLLEHDHPARERLDGDDVVSPVLDSVVKLRNSSSIQVRSASGSLAAMNEPGSIACTTW